MLSPRLLIRVLLLVPVLFPTAVRADDKPLRQFIDAEMKAAWQRDKITPESHAINDLGIDSLDFLDIAFAIDKAFGIKMPLEQWTQEVNDGKVSTEEYFVLGNLCKNIDKLVAAKAA